MMRVLSGRSNGKHMHRIRVRGSSAGAATQAAPEEQSPFDSSAGSSSAPHSEGPASGHRPGNGPNCESRRCRRERLAAEADPAAALANAQVHAFSRTVTV